MPNFYISEILFLTKFTETKKDTGLKFADIKELVLEHLQNKGESLPFQPSNVLWYNSELTNFKIALAREIIQETQYANWDQRGIRILVLLNFESASLAAQNALLKLIEEPPVNTLIILPVVSDHRLLTTISSRCFRCQITKNNFDNDKIINNKREASQNEKDDFTWPKNLAAVFALVNQHKDRETAKKLVKNLLKEKRLNYQQKQALSQAYIDLEANLNVRLTLEHCFFSTF